MLRFFPPAGVRVDSSSTSRDANGAYWSSSAGTASQGWFIEFLPGFVQLSSWHRIRGYSVRCVAQWNLVTTCCFNCSFVFNFQLSLFNFHLNCCVAQ